jgi:hypothetical protein
MVGVAGQPRPLLFESFEEWEWRVLRTGYGPEVRRVHRDLEMLDPTVAARIVTFEERLAAEGIRANRRETWRTPQRQAYLFQQGRSRPGPLATTTLTSWHSQVDGQGHPAGRAVDYDVAASLLRRFHEIATDVGLASYGADSYDPGHVYLPLADAIPSSDFILLRTIARVPEVTLATGVPVDRPLPAGGRELLRQRSFAFAELPYSPYPRARIAAPSRAQTLLARSQIRPMLPLRLASGGASREADE